MKVGEDVYDSSVVPFPADPGLQTSLIPDVQENNVKFSQIISEGVSYFLQVITFTFTTNYMNGKAK